MRFVASLLIAVLLTGGYAPLVRAGALPTPDMALNGLWNNYGDQGGHWTGGDGTISAALPDGRIVWFFSDTFLGTVNSNASRSTSTPFVHNSMVVQQGNTLTTLTGGTSNAPASLVEGTTPDNSPNNAGYWVDDALVTNNQLAVFYTRYLHIGPGALDIKQMDTVIALFSLPDLTLTGVTPLGIGTVLKWGTALLDQPDYTYIYGVEDTGVTKFLYLARSPHGQLIVAGNNPTATWRFWTGGGWSVNESDAIQMISGVGDGFSVVQMGSQYALLTQNTHEIFSPNLVAYPAATPMGPFGNQVDLYRTPETGGNIITYDVRAHPEIKRTGKLVLSYNVNSLQLIDNFVNARLYRPRFIDIAWPVAPPLTASRCQCR